MPSTSRLPLGEEDAARQIAAGPDRPLGGGDCQPPNRWADDRDQAEGSEGLHLGYERHGFWARANRPARRRYDHMG